jgi:argininosuccinate synthase
VEDLREEFLTEFVWPTLRAGAIYNRKYLLGTSMARPIIARGRWRWRAVGASALAHGCTGKGNDQVRFELTYAGARAGDEGDRPLARVGHPLARGRARVRRRARRARSPRPEKIYSRDRNLWHISHEGGPLEDPNWEPPEDLFLMTRSPRTRRTGRSTSPSASSAATRSRWTASRSARWRCWSG